MNINFYVKNMMMYVYSKLKYKILYTINYSILLWQIINQDDDSGSSGPFLLENHVSNKTNTCIFNTFFF